MTWKNESQRHSMSAKGIKTIQVRMPTISRMKVTIHPGDKIIADRELKILHWITRYGETYIQTDTLHEGQYIVDYCDKFDCHLVDAEWDKDGNITFKSNKHGHLIGHSQLRNLIKVMI